MYRPILPLATIDIIAGLPVIFASGIAPGAGEF